MSEGDSFADPEETAGGADSEALADAIVIQCCIVQTC